MIPNKTLATGGSETWLRIFCGFVLTRQGIPFRHIGDLCRRSRRIWVRGDGFGEMSVTSKAIPQGAIRIGNRDSWFWSMGVFDNLPLLSRGAPIDMGLGFALDQRRSTLWLGVGAGVYDGTVYAAKSDIAVGERWLLNVGLTAGGNGQVAASLGAGIRF